MKLTYQQLEQHLEKKLAPLYIVSGDEILLTQETLDTIRKSAHRHGFSERQRISMESDWLSQLLAETQTLSLFSNKRIIELDLTNIKLNAATSKGLKEISEQLSSDILLLIRIHKLDSKAEQSAWFQALEKAGVAISLWPVTPEQLPAWIMQRAKQSQLVLTKAAAELLATRVEGNLLAAAQEIEKLCLLQLNTTIDIDTIATAVTDNSHFDIFIFVDSVLNGNQKRSLHILKNLCEEDIEPTLILWALTRELRTLHEMMQLSQQGTPLPSLFGKFRIWEKRQPGVRAFMKRNTPQKCWEFLSKAAEIDRIIKGAEKGNVWNALQQLVLMV